MKLIETLTQQQMTNLLSGQVEGVFVDLFTDTMLEEYAYAICSGYYLYHSGEKKIPRFYEKVLNEQENANALITTMLKAKYLVRWENIFKALFTYSYSPLDDYSKTEVKTGTNKDTTTYNTSKAKNGTDTDTTTYNITNAEDETLSKEENVTRDTSNASDIYGFNSSTPVGDTLDTNSESETTTNTDTKNNTYKKTGTESKEYGVNETETNTGTDTKDYNINEKLEINGRNVHATELLEKEIRFNVLNDISKIIYSDIDSLITLDVYERS